MRNYYMVYSEEYPEKNFLLKGTPNQLELFLSNILVDMNSPFSVEQAFTVTNVNDIPNLDPSFYIPLTDKGGWKYAFQDSCCF